MSGFQFSKNSKNRNFKSGSKKKSGNFRATRSTFSPNSSRKEVPKIKLGRWIILAVILFTAYSYWKPSDSGSQASSQSQPNSQHPEGSQAQTSPLKQSSVSLSTSKAALAKESSSTKKKDPLGEAFLWRHKRLHLSQGFLKEEFVFPNEKAVWENIFSHQDTSEFYQDTLLMVAGEAWGQLVNTSAQKVTLTLLKNHQGSLRYWSWASGKVKQNWYIQDSIWVNEDFCIRDQRCFASPLMNAQRRLAKSLFKEELWRSDSSLNVYAPFDGEITEHTGSPKSGRSVSISNSYQKIKISGLGNTSPGLKVGSKIHRGMKIGTLLHSKKSLHTVFKEHGSHAFLEPHINPLSHQQVTELKNRMKVIREVIPQG